MVVKGRGDEDEVFLCPYFNLPECQIWNYNLLLISESLCSELSISGKGENFISCVFSVASQAADLGTR